MPASAAQLIEDKLNRRFDFLDKDSDGYLTAADYELIVQQLLDTYQPAPGSPAVTDLRTKFMRLWAGLKKHADSDGDGMVSREEYVKAAKAGMFDRDGGYDRVMRPVQEATLRLAGGTDGLTADEFSRLMGTVGVDAAYASKFFATIDTNRDGAISIEEYLQADREFYTSDDPAAAGNLLYGELTNR